MTSLPKQQLPPVIKHLQQKNQQRKLKEEDDQYNYDTNSKWIIPTHYTLPILMYWSVKWQHINGNSFILSSQINNNQ